MLLRLPDELLEAVVRAMPLDDQARAACVNRRLNTVVAAVNAAGALRREFRTALECAVLGGGRKRKFYPEVMLSACIPGAAWVMAYGGPRSERRLALGPELSADSLEGLRYTRFVMEFPGNRAWVYGVVLASPPRIQAVRATYEASGYLQGVQERHGLERSTVDLPADRRIVSAVGYLTCLSAAPSLCGLFV